VPPAAFDEVLALCPDLAERVGSVWDELAASGLDTGVLAACRQRVAEVLGADAGSGGGTGGGSVPDEGLRACLALADRFVADPHTVTDADTDTVRDLVGDRGLVALMIALALADGFSRAHRAWRSLIDPT